MEPTYALSHLHSSLQAKLLIFRMSHSAGSKKPRLMCRLIENQVACDPEAHVPSLHAKPLWISERTSTRYCPYIMFKIKPEPEYATAPVIVPSLRPFGVSTLAPEIISNLREIQRGIDKRLEDSDYMSDQTLRTYAIDARQRVFRAILDPVLDAKRKAYESRGDVKPPFLTIEPRKGYQVRYGGQLRYIIATARYAVNFPSRDGKGRSYFIVMFDQYKRDKYHTHPVDQLISYMGIVHRNRKDRGEENSVVYGLYTDTHEFTFYKINSESQMFSSRKYMRTGKYNVFRPFGLAEDGTDPTGARAGAINNIRSQVYDLYWDRKRGELRTQVDDMEDVVTHIENILNNGDRDCNGLETKEPEWTDEYLYEAKKHAGIQRRK